MAAVNVPVVVDEEVERNDVAVVVAGPVVVVEKDTPTLLLLTGVDVG